MESGEMQRQQCKLGVRIPLSTLKSPMRCKRGELSFCHLARGSGTNKQVDQGPTTAVTTKQWGSGYE